MFFLYLQSSSASRQPTILNLMFFANPVYRLQSHPNTWHLKAFQCHGRTRSSNNSIFLFELYQFFIGKYSTFIYNPQALLESEKNSNIVYFTDLVHRVQRDPSMTLRCIKVGNGPLSARLSDVHWVMHAVKVFQINASSLFVCCLSKNKGVACIHWPL